MRLVLPQLAVTKASSWGRRVVSGGEIRRKGLVQGSLRCRRRLTEGRETEGCVGSVRGGGHNRRGRDTMYGNVVHERWLWGKDIVERNQ